MESKKLRLVHNSNNNTYTMKLSATLAAAFIGTAAFGQVDLINKVKDNGADAPLSYEWETVVDIEATPVKNQGSSGTCWSYATTSFVDAQIGRVLKKLKETGLDKSTIIIFTSDHGYHLGEKGHWQKQTLYDRATKVPLIFSGPGIMKGKTVNDQPVELVDLYKTIMDFTGISVPSFVQGTSLKGALTGEQNVQRESALSELRLYVKGNLAQGYAIKTKRYRLIRWYYKQNNFYELYDHEYDTDEINNVFYNDNYSTVADSLITILNSRIKEARIRPDGIGRQIKNAKPNYEPKRINSTKKSKY